MLAATGGSALGWARPHSTQNAASRGKSDAQAQHWVGADTEFADEIGTSLDQTDTRRRGSAGPRKFRILLVFAGRRPREDGMSGHRGRLGNDGFPSDSRIVLR